ncbi:MCM2/3/5 family-domain-containing protein [Chlamydoabsidia padenii]|nr:MCM2/3/5 family-domain-containing protein [Chlamydoabsidia padenii]
MAVTSKYVHSWDRRQVYSTSVLPGEERINSRSELKLLYLEFIQNFRIGNSYVYRDQLQEHLMLKQYYIQVDMGHLINYNAKLANKLTNSPAEHLPLFETAVKESAKRILFATPGTVNDSDIPDGQVTLTSEANSTYIGKLVRIPGIVIGASTLSSRATHVNIMCRSCRHTKVVPVNGRFSGITLPRVCDNPQSDSIIKPSCLMDSYVIMHNKCSFVDSQVLKLQKASDWYLLNSTGAATVRTPYIRVVGLQRDQHNSNRGRTVFTDTEEEEYIRMSRQPDLFETFASSIASSIFGNKDIKKAITCLLFSGSKKILPDGMRLCGDISVLLLGDPGTAKSQLLKFVEKVAPIAVYTSGKGSSAANLSASRDFYLEGGARVLADGGVVCIHEFDKMRDEDRNIFAAANPVFGRYDDMKSPGENIDFQMTILSRFDMLFIVKDEHNEARDISITKHVLNVHMDRQIQDTTMGDIDLEKMKAYINYCKAKCAPRLTPEAAQKLSSHFVAIRKKETQIRSSIPITIRRLEAIIRIFESLYSTMDAVQNGGAGGMTRNEVMAEVQSIEQEIQHQLPIGSQAPVMKIKNDLLQQGYSEAAIVRALSILGKVVFRQAV